MNSNQHQKIETEEYNAVKKVNECIRDFNFENNDFDYIKAEYKLEVDLISVFIDKLNNGESLTEDEDKILLESSLKLSRLEKHLISKTKFNSGLIEGLQMELSRLIHDKYGVWI